MRGDWQWAEEFCWLPIKNDFVYVDLTKLFI